MTTTPTSLEELVQLLSSGRKIYFGSDELNKLGLIEIIKHRLESWGMPAAQQPDPMRDIVLGPAHDPTDMTKIPVEPPRESEMNLVEIGGMISDAAEELQKADDAGSPEASWLIDLHARRAHVQAQIAQAQAQYATALQLRDLRELLEEALPTIAEQISNEIAGVAVETSGLGETRRRR